MRVGVLATIVLGFAASAHGEPTVDSDLRALADRAAKFASPAGLAPLFEERVAASDTAGLGAVIRGRTGREAMGAADHGWLAAAHGAAGERADVVRLAAKVEAELKAEPGDALRYAAMCGVAVGFEYLGVHADADRWRKLVAGSYAWCSERLPVIAARRGHPDRAAALLAELSSSARVTAILGIAEVYSGGPEKARIAPLLEDAAKLIDDDKSGAIDRSTVLPDVAIAWATAGNKVKAKELAKQALARLDEEVKAETGTAMVLLLAGDEVAAGLRAAGETAALAKLVARMEKARAKDDRLVARLQNARVVAKFGAKKRAASLLAGVAWEVDNSKDVGRMYAERFALIDAYLAIGDLPAALYQASHTSVTQPIEVEALVKVARHCRKVTCARTPAVADAITAVGARLDKFDKLMNRKP